MSDFGKRSDGWRGRRAASRQHLLLPAMIATMADWRSVEMLNVSTTGAKLRGAALPDVGETVLVKVSDLHLLATVVWNRTGACGIAFDEPLNRIEVGTIRSAAIRVRVTHLTPEEIQALDDWAGGFAR